MRRTHRSHWLLGTLALLAFMGRHHLRRHHELLRKHHRHSYGGATEGI